jgi:hypothetical protein
VSLAATTVTLQPSAFVPLALGFFGLGVGCLIDGPQELVGFPARERRVDMTTSAGCSSYSRWSTSASSSPVSAPCSGGACSASPHGHRALADGTVAAVLNMARGFNLPL